MVSRRLGKNAAIPRRRGKNTAIPRRAETNSAIPRHSPDRLTALRLITEKAGEEGRGEFTC